MSQFMPLPVGSHRGPPPMVWWIIWASLIAGQCALYVALGRGPTAAGAANPFENLVGLVPLFVSIIVRWLVLPRYTDRGRAFVTFIVGCSLAEACTILGIFLGGPYRDDLFVLGVLGVMQFAPFFLKRLGEPKPQGFIPNN